MLASPIHRTDHLVKTTIHPVQPNPQPASERRRPVNPSSFLDAGVSFSQPTSSFDEIIRVDSGADNNTSSMEMLDRLGGLSQPEFTRIEDRKDETMGFSCLSAVRLMQETGRFEEACRELEKEVHKAKDRGPFEYGICCCMISELLNRWGATMAEYSVPLTEQASTFGSTAVDVLRDLPGEEALETALFWKSLNTATLGGNGGGEKWSAEQALTEAKESLQELKALTHKRNASPQEGQARCDFVDGIIHFSMAKAVRKGALEGGETLANKFQTDALELFESSYTIWEEEYGEEHPDTVKAVTMIAFSYKLLQRLDEAVEWATKEYILRCEIFGEHHPRTARAKVNLRQLQIERGGEAGLGVEQEKEEEQEEEEDISKYCAAHVDSSRITWQLDPFELDDEMTVNGVLQMFVASGSSRAFKIPEASLVRLVLAAKKKYHNNNTFHNWRHAWSVTQSAYLITMSPSILKCLGPIDRLAILVAALLHDIDHPGVNNDFLIKSADPLALKFPTPNVLERHHWYLCENMLAKGKPTDIFENLDDDERERVMSMIHIGIMATDMAMHKTIVNQLQERAGKAGRTSDPIYDPTVLSDRCELVQAILHTADLSAQSMPAGVAYKFGQGIVEEFHVQYMRERREKLPESAFMKDMHKPLAQAKAQLGFLQYVAGPLWKAFSRTFGEFRERYSNIKERAKEIDFDQVHRWQGLNKGLFSLDQASFSARSFNRHIQLERDRTPLGLAGSGDHSASSNSLCLEPVVESDNGEAHH